MSTGIGPEDTTEPLKSEKKLVGDFEKENLEKKEQNQDLPPRKDMNLIRRMIEEECDKLKETLLLKNKAYGNSALDPIRIFSKASPEEQLRVRIDDKLSRLVRGKNIDKVPEDIYVDLPGYFILVKVEKRIEALEELEKNKCL